MMRRFFLTGVLVSQCLGWSHCLAQGWDTGNFHTNDGYPRTYSITFTPAGAPPAEQWYTDDPYVVTNIFVTNTWASKGIGDTSLVQYSTAAYTRGVRADGYNNVYFGTYAWSAAQYYDYLPGRTNPSLYKWFPPVVTNTNRTVKFIGEFSVIRNADIAWPNKDTFGFDLLSKTTNGGVTNLASLAKFDFNPHAPILTNAATMLFEWRRGGDKQAASIPGLTGNWPLTYGDRYRLTASIKGSRFDVDLDLLSGPVGTNIWTVKLINQGQLTEGFTSADFNTLGIRWALQSANPFAPGSKNYILLNRLAVLRVPNGVENWLSSAGWPASSPLGTKTDGRAFTLLEQYAMGASAPETGFEKPSVKPAVIEGTPCLELVSVVRTNDPSVTVVGEAVHGLRDFSEPGLVSTVPGVAAGVDQAGVPSGCERRAFRVSLGDTSQRFLRLRTRISE